MMLYDEKDNELMQFMVAVIIFHIMSRTAGVKKSRRANEIIVNLQITQQIEGIN